MNKKKQAAMLFMLGWACFFVIAMTLNKFLDHSIPTEMVVFYRLTFALCWFFPYILKNKKTVFKTKILKRHFLRSIFTALTIYCTYYAYRHLPLPIATSIGLSGPLFTIILAAFFLKERLTFFKTSIILIGYIGVLFVVIPPSSNDFIYSIFIFEKAIFMALLGNFSMGITLILLKKITFEDPPQTILFYNTFLTLLLFTVFNVSSFFIPDIKNLTFLILIGFFGIMLQYCYTKAMSLESASFIAPFEYLRIVIALPVGIFIFNEHMNFQQIIGTTIICLTTYILLKKETHA
ncbi:MAG: Riboflavin transporter [Holosporales bacterium]